MIRGVVKGLSGKSGALPFALCLLSLIFLLWIAPGALASPFLVARIVAVDHPRSVAPLEAFRVVVTAEYERSLYVDVAILDLDKGEVVQALTLISNFHGPGEESFTFNLTAPAREGVWRLEAATRAWWRNSWFADPNQGSAKFEIKVSQPRVKEAALTLVSPFPGVEVWIDGEPLRVSKPLTVRLKAGNHTLRAQPLIQVSEGTRLVFVGWSDGVTSNPRRVFLSSGTTLSLIYEREHLLKLDSSIDLVKGGGWYREGELGKLKAPKEAFKGGRSYIFKGWRGDVESLNASVTVRMDEPKEVKAVWVEEAPSPLLPESILKVSFTLVAISIFNAIVVAARRRGALAACLLALILLGFAAPAAGGPAELEVGGTVWRYWRNPGSDTCLIWLGGGVAGDNLFINPYRLESYNTMRFVQDLARFYSVLAIEEGSKARVQTELNRVIRGEVYRGGGFLERARRWALESGYSQVYLVGYSVGGMAALREAAIENPEAWRSPNGLILITVPADRAAQRAAARLQGNLLVLYGEKMPKFYVESGEEFFRRAPNEGRYEWGWLHKAIYVLPAVAHEVWTVAETGEYNPKAARLVVKFIEESKSLHYGLKVEPGGPGAKLNEVKVEAEPSLEVGEPLRVKVEARGLRPGKYTFIAEPLAGEAGPSVASVEAKGGRAEALIVIPKPTGGPFEIKLRAVGEANLDLGIHRVRPSGPAVLRIVVGFPRVPVKVDGLALETGGDGTAATLLPAGFHAVEVPKEIELGPKVRLLFKGWIDGSNSTRLIVNVLGVRELTAVYVKQFLVEARSAVGNVEGGGWRDENSLVALRVEPQIVEEESGVKIFEGWLVGGGIKAGDRVYVDEPLEAEAVWRSIELPETSAPKRALALALLALASSSGLLAGTSILALKEVLARRRGLS